MAKPDGLSLATRDAASMLGALIAARRRERSMTLEDLAQRVGVSRTTMHKIERGDPGVRLGSAFEAATIVGVPLFSPDPTTRDLARAAISERLAVLPERVRRPTIDDDF